MSISPCSDRYDAQRGDKCTHGYSVTIRAAVNERCYSIDVVTVRLRDEEIWGDRRGKEEDCNETISFKKKATKQKNKNKNAVPRGSNLPEGVKLCLRAKENTHVFPRAPRNFS